MTARTIPDEPDFRTESEQLVWRRLRDGLPDDALLLANLRISDEEQDHEADLVVLRPGAGVLVLEVKGGSVWVEDDPDGQPRWWIRRHRRPRPIDPVAQARRTKYALRDYVEHDPRWSRGRIPWAHGVVTPFSGFPTDFAMPDCPRWALHDRDDLDDLPARVADNIRRGGHGPVSPAYADLDLVAEILRGRGFTAYDRNAEALERQAQADRLTQEQAALLQVTRLLRRVEIRGGAGSGKTILALTQAKQLAAGRGGQAPSRVALLCYSIGLAEFLKREVEQWPRYQRPAYVGTFEDLGRSWGAPTGDRQDSDFWEHRLPALMADLAAALPDEEKFDAFLVDEAQDFAESWWTPLLRALRDEDGGLYAYTDENQRIFARFGRPPVPLVPLVLDHNLRNTRQICDAFAPLAPTTMKPQGGDGVEVSFVPVGTDEDADAVADEAVGVLLDAGWHPGNISLLTTGHRHFMQVRLTDELGQVGYWKTFWDADDVFYGHVLGCKGLERPAVVLCVNQGSAQDRSRERLYVGMSRATDQLIVVGEPELVREIGGPTVAARLGI
ncbi:MAG TPA: NERD domain-containing protein [Marmoricola sp.]|nr:NERD domain-containing protein [Marmoricola sp.]